MYEKKEKSLFVNCLKDFYHFVGHRLTYKIPVLFVTALAFLYSMTQQTLGVDDLRRDYYYGTHGGYWFGRWGCILWTRFMGVTPYASFADRFFSMFFLVVAGVLAAVIFFVLIRRKGSFSFREAWPYTVLTCGLISYPLINEEWEYTVMDFCMTGNLMLCSAAMLYLVLQCDFDDRMFLHKNVWKKWLLPSLLLMLSAASYETGSFYYVSLACMVLFFRYAFCFDPSGNSSRGYRVWSESRQIDRGGENLAALFSRAEHNEGRMASGKKCLWLREGFYYAVPLAIGLLFRYGISFAVNTIAGKAFFGGGDTTIEWGSNSLLEVLKRILTNYGLKALIYYPITVFVLCLLLFSVLCLVMAVERHSFAPIGFGVLVAVSLFALSFVKGDVQPYRTSQTLSLFAGFVLFLFVLMFADQWQSAGRREKSGSGKRMAFQISVLLSLVLCVHMAAWMNWILSLNHQRSQNEEAMVYQIGYRLTSEYPIDEKPVVFVGWENLGSGVEGKVRANADHWNGNWYIRLYRRIWHMDPVNLRGPESNVNSVITWSRQTNDMLYELFHFHGFDLNIASWGPNQALFAQAEQIAEDENIGPYGISEQENYIIVCLNYFPNEF